MISFVKKTIDIPLVVAGGIRTPQYAFETIKAGADIVHIGAAFENVKRDFAALEKKLYLMAEAVKKVFDLRPGKIIEHLDLLKPIYRQTAAYGHFGRNGVSWEKTDKVEELKNSI